MTPRLSFVRPGAVARVSTHATADVMSCGSAGHRTPQEAPFSPDPVKQRARGHSVGGLLLGLAAAQLAGQDYLALTTPGLIHDRGQAHRGGALAIGTAPRSRTSRRYALRRDFA